MKMMIEAVPRALSLCLEESAIKHQRCKGETTTLMLLKRKVRITSELRWS